MSRLILLFTRDPGGSNVLIPLITPLKLMGYEVLLYGKDKAIEQFRKFHLTARVFPFQNIKKFLVAKQPDVILTGTSGIDNTEKNIWIEARKLNIPTFAILDQWMNFEKRFSCLFLPDFIFAMDNMAKNDLINIGIKKTQIIVSGQPYFEYIMNQKSYKPHDVDPKNFVITFVSEPIQSFYNNSLGYTEYSILETLLETLSSIVKISTKKLKLIIKLHPNDEKNKYDILIKNMASKSFHVTLDKTTNSLKLIEKSNVVCGMASMVLLESVLLGVQTISIQIGLKSESRFILDRTGISKSIRNKVSLGKILKAVIFEGGIPLPKFHPKMDAVSNILSTIEKKVWLN